MHPDDELYNQLAFYTLAHPDPAFIHQLAVDAFTAQRADQHTKPIAVAFALIGLYLHLEKGYTGRQVQKAHIQLARWPNLWPRLPLPPQRGEIRIQHVLAIEPGPDRDAMVDRWCASVWESWRDSRPEITEISRKFLGTG